jgi:pepF/M3 family oligoendopeptidase
VPAAARGVARAAQPRPAEREQLGAQPLLEVAWIGAGADLGPRLLDHGARSLHGQRIVRGPGQLVHRGEIAKLHGEKSRVAAVAVQEALPHWDLTPFFSAPDAPEVDAALTEARAGIAALRELVDGGGLESDFDGVVTTLNSLLERFHLLEAYLHGEVSVDSRNDVAQARLSELMQEAVALANVETRITAWLGETDADALLERSEQARDHEYAIRRAQIRAQHLMSQSEEELAAELSLSGSTAWGKLHGDVTSRLMVTLELDGEERRLPMSEVRNLASNPDRDVRRRAYEVELEVWEQAAVPLAAAINSVKGATNVLAERRNWESALDQALFSNAIDRETLDAVLEAVRESLPDFRRYFRTKAQALGIERLAWYDISAPLPGEGRRWTYDEAREFIVEQFGTYSERMREYGERAFRENWIDAEPREGKRDGAFCMPVRGDESRIMANFAPAYDGVATLAHELGHGYHNINLASRTELQKRTPMTLAETASIFCETIVREGALAEAEGSPAEQIEILEGSLQNAAGVVVDILGRFLFESRLLEGRRKRELSVAELCELMVEAQKESYGDGLDEAKLHPYMWAMKPHYYFSSFYNYPYTFGLLFGLGLYAGYEREPDEFRAGYDDLLSSTGLADAATLASRFGIDVRSPDFWRSSLDQIRADIERYCASALTGSAGDSAHLRS